MSEEAELASPAAAIVAQRRLARRKFACYTWEGYTTPHRTRGTARNRLNSVHEARQGAPKKSTSAHREKHERPPRNDRRPRPVASPSIARPSGVLELPCAPRLRVFFIYGTYSS
jgi:hypothetical protein